MEHDRYNSFFLDLESNIIQFGSKLRWNLSPRSNSIQFESKCKSIFLIARPPNPPYLRSGVAGIRRFFRNRFSETKFSETNFPIPNVPITTFFRQLHFPTVKFSDRQIFRIVCLSEKTNFPRNKLGLHDAGRCYPLKQLYVRSSCTACLQVTICFICL